MPAPEDAEVRAEELVGRAGEEVDARRRHVDRAVRGEVDRVDVEERPRRVRRLGRARDVVHRPDGVRRPADGHELRPLADERRGGARRSRCSRPGRSRASAPSRRGPRPRGATARRSRRGRGASRRPRPPASSRARGSAPSGTSASSCSARRRSPRAAPRRGSRPPPIAPRRRPRRRRGSSGKAPPWFAFVSWRYRTIRSVTSRGTCVPPGLSRITSPEARAGKRERIASRSSIPKG